MFENTAVKVVHQQVAHLRLEFKQTRVQQYHYFEMLKQPINSASTQQQLPLWFQ